MPTAQMQAKVWNVIFAVQVQQSPSNWFAGNGEAGRNGWIINKSLYLNVLELPGEYQLDILGTSP